MLRVVRCLTCWGSCRVFTGGDDGQLVVWDVASVEGPQATIYKSHSKAITAVARDGDGVLTSSRDASCRLTVLRDKVQRRGWARDYPRVQRG